MDTQEHKLKTLLQIKQQILEAETGTEQPEPENACPPPGYFDFGQETQPEAQESTQEETPEHTPQGEIIEKSPRWTDEERRYLDMQPFDLKVLMAEDPGQIPHRVRLRIESMIEREEETKKQMEFHWLNGRR